MRFAIITSILCSIFFLQPALAQQRDLLYYQTQAHANNPVLKENDNQQLFNNLQNNITLAQFRKPQLNVTADYLFAPFFSNNGHAMSITTTPDNDAYGYDVNLSNGGLY